MNSKKFSFFLWGLVILQLLTAVFHSLSFFVNEEPKNETEKQLTDLMETYPISDGMGFNPTMSTLFLALSTCFTFICLLAGISNWFFKKKELNKEYWKGWMLIQTIIFGAIFLVMLKFTFIYPVMLTGLIFVFAFGTYVTVKK